MGKTCVWEEIIGQSRAVTFLQAAAREESVTHAYLFVGTPGVGKKTAAKAFACALLCDDEGCGACRACTRIKRGTHPDVKVMEPEGAATYVVGQIREIIHDIGLKPIEAARKVYVLDRAGSFNAEAANALLKSLEEPPEDVVLILLARSIDAVLPTISSRCQAVRFDRISQKTAVDLLVESTGVGEDTALAALAAAGGVLPRALEILRSPDRLSARDGILAALKNLAFMDGLDVLDSAKALMLSVRAPLDEMRRVHEAELAAHRELMGGATSTRSLEEKHKRELTAKEREGLIEILNVTESWLRDCLAISRGVGELVENRDQADAMQEVGAVLPAETAVSALASVGRARRRISYNVSPQLALETMLIDVREVLRCPQ